MKTTNIILPRRSAVKKHDVRLIVVIAVSWTIVDFILFLIRLTTDTFTPKYASTHTGAAKTILLRELNVFIISLIMGYFLVSVFRNFLRHISPGLNLFLKTLLLLTVILFMNFFIYFSFGMAIEHQSASGAFSKFTDSTFRKEWLFQKLPEWVLLFVLTQLFIEINENYSPGVFLNIMVGKYLQPREENRIIMFIDLKNSTPIAEKLGHKEYFKFIRDVIYCISAGVAQHNGRIYQYVGDEVVAWWPSSSANARKSVDSIIEARKILNKNAEIFKRGYDILPEYKVGIHAGNVTIGQIGTTKKDIVMSGDTINTAARIRSACNELNQKFVVSKQVIELLGMKDWQTESLGLVDLKGKNEGIELFALKI